jgi:hypothetical protein
MLALGSNAMVNLPAPQARHHSPVAFRGAPGYTTRVSPARSGTAHVFKREVQATVDQITTELQEAFEG